MDRKYAVEVLRLISNYLSPESEESFSFSDEELVQIYKTAKAHWVLAITGDALEKAGISSKEFHFAQAVARRNKVLFDNELSVLGEKFAENHVRFMPLKGSVLKDCYPRTYQREMKDIDILIEPSDREKVRDLMEDMGYNVERYDIKNEDIYHKKPMLAVEIHSYLFDSKPYIEYFDYYADVFDRLIPFEGSKYEYRFKPEDLYIYMTLHTRKHALGSGVGLKYLLDTYLFLKRTDSGFSWDYVTSELRKTGSDEFEQKHRTLAQKVFTSQPLDESEEAALDDYIDYGTHGTLRHYVDQKLQGSSQKHAKARYLVRRIFPTGDDIPPGHGFIEKHKILLPALWAYRPIKALKRNPRRVRKELKAIIRHKDKSK